MTRTRVFVSSVSLVVMSLGALACGEAESADASSPLPSVSATTSQSGVTPGPSSTGTGTGTSPAPVDPSDPAGPTNPADPTDPTDPELPAGCPASAPNDGEECSAEEGTDCEYEGEECSCEPAGGGFAGGMGGGFAGFAGGGDDEDAGTGATLEWSCSPVFGEPDEPVEECPTSAPEDGSDCDPMANSEDCAYDDGTECTCEGGGGGFGGFGGGGGDGEWSCEGGDAPTEPAPTEPAPTEPAPTEPAPTEPAPTDPEVPEEPTGDDALWTDAWAVMSGTCAVQGCHGNPGGVAGFALSSDDEEASRTAAMDLAEEIADVVGSGEMPPMSGASISDEQRAAIVAWAEAQ
jgi:Cytochrome C oxidase, cbb3-type, subunit III